MTDTAPSGKDHAILLQYLERALASEGRTLVERRPATEEMATVFEWPWHPFRDPVDDDEVCALESMRLHRRLRAVGVAKTGLGLEDRPDLCPYLAEGHLPAIRKAGGPVWFAASYREVLGDRFLDPDWPALFHTLVTERQLDPVAAAELSLLDVLRHLQALRDRPPEGSKPRRRHSRPRQGPGNRPPRLMTELERNVLDKHGRGWSVRDVADDQKCSRNNVYKALKRGQEKLRAGMAGRSNGSSLSAMSGVEDLEQRPAKATKNLR